MYALEVILITACVFALLARYKVPACRECDGAQVGTDGLKCESCARKEQA